MAATEQLVIEEEQRALAVAMAWVAGYVDAVGYILLFGLFTAHMSGNTVRLGVDLGRGDASDALARAVPIGVFVIGVAFGTLLVELAVRHHFKATLGLLVAVEAALLIAFALIADSLVRAGYVRGRAGGWFFLLASMSVLAMAMQTAALQRIGGRTVRTTYVTGMLTQFAVDGMLVLLAGRDRDPQLVRRVVLLGSIWMSYATGAVVGSFAAGRWSFGALVAPITVLLIVVVADFVRPVPSRR
jgi:uncharacterized membrane protein YoaK (UPF0700 family)